MSAPDTARAERRHAEIHLSESDPIGSPRRAAAGWEVALAVGVTVVALLPFLLTIVFRWAGDYVPVGDSAIIDLRVRDVWSSQIPLTGAYSRYGWSHPGPLMHWLFAAVAGPLGGRPWTVLIASALLQGAAIVWLSRLAWKAGRLPMVVLWLAILMLAYAGTGGWMLVEVWNPYVAFPFFALFLLQCWLIFNGDPDRLVGATVVGSFLAQTHIGYLPLVGVLLAASVLLVGWRARQEGKRPWDLTPVKWTLLVAMVLWLPPLIDGLVHSPGNSTRILAALREGNAEPAIGLYDSAGFVADAFLPLPLWLQTVDGVAHRVTAAVPASGLRMVFLVGAGLLLGWVGARRHDRVVKVTALFVVLTLAASWLAIAVVTGPPYPYLFQWRLVVSAFVTVAICYLVLRTTRLIDRPLIGVAVVTVSAVAIMFGSLRLVTDADLRGEPVWALAPVVQDFADELAPQASSRDVVLRYAGSAQEGVHASLVNELDRRDAGVYVEDQLGFVFGDSRVRSADEADEIWYVVEDGLSLSLLTQRAGATVLVQTSPLAPAEEADIVELQRRIAQRLTERGRSDLVARLNEPQLSEQLAFVPGIDPKELARLDRLNDAVAVSGSCRCGVVGFAPSAAPA